MVFQHLYPGVHLLAPLLGGLHDGLGVAVGRIHVGLLVLPVVLADDTESADKYSPKRPSTGTLQS